jgi:serine/threonine protein kinase
MRQIGRYRLDAVQGSGAFATVWRGYDTELEVPVAVKVLAENWAHHADVRERFLAEARLLRRLESSRVVRVHDIGTETFDGTDRPYFVMDFAGGGSLDAVADGSLAPAEAVRLAVEGCRAVHVLHAAGVVHRDVKPGNLLVADDGRVLVADLGSVKRLAEATGFTVTTGTPAYMAPEQASGGRIDARTDVYALAVVTFVLVTGALPFDVPDAAAVLRRSDGERPRGLARTRGAAASPLLSRLDAVLDRALSRDPDHRHASAEALAVELERVTAGHRPRRRPGWPTWVVVPAALLLFTAAAAATWYGLR